MLLLINKLNNNFFIHPLGSKLLIALIMKWIKFHHDMKGGVYKQQGLGAI